DLIPLPPHGDIVERDRPERASDFGIDQHAKTPVRFSRDAVPRKMIPFGITQLAVRCQNLAEIGLRRVKMGEAPGYFPEISPDPLEHGPWQERADVVDDEPPDRRVLLSGQMDADEAPE